MENLVNRPVQSKKRYVISFIIGTVVFILILLLGYYLSYIEFFRVSQAQTDLAYTIFEDKLYFNLFNQSYCSNTSYSKVSEDLGFQGRIIDDLEKKFGKNHEGVLLRKKFYTLVELEHFEFVKNMNKQCKTNVSTIFFFYSNEKDDLGNGEELGKLLGVVYSKHPNLVIYSFDINLKSELIRKLKEKYKIDGPNILIVNDNFKLINPQNIKEIEVYLP